MVRPPARNLPIVLNGQATQVFYDWMTAISDELNTLTGLVSGLTVLDGAGSPESVVVADSNRWYRDTVTDDVYIKTTDGGNTGWVLV